MLLTLNSLMRQLQRFNIFTSADYEWKYKNPCLTREMNSISSVKRLNVLYLLKLFDITEPIYIFKQSICKH